MHHDETKKKCHGGCHCKGSDTHVEKDVVSNDPAEDAKDASVLSKEDAHTATEASNPLQVMEALKKEKEEFKDKYLRALAEIENSRKRLMRERVEAQGLAVQNVIVDMLQPFDQLEMALHHADKAAPEVKAWAMGFQMILEHFRQVFSTHGVSSFTSVGMLFDPHLHEAIETEEKSDVQEGTILQEFQKGYRMGGKTIRPAKVKVATQPKSAEEALEENEQPQENAPQSSQDREE